MQKKSSLLSVTSIFLLQWASGHQNDFNMWRIYKQLKLAYEYLWSILLDQWELKCINVNLVKLLLFYGIIFNNFKGLP